MNRTELSLWTYAPAESMFLYYFIGAMALVFFISVFITRALGRTKSQVMELVGNEEYNEPTAAYLVAITTSLRCGCGCPDSVKVFMQLIGDRDESPYFALKADKAGRPMLKRGLTDIFLVKVKESLGWIDRVELVMCGVEGQLKWKVSQIQLYNPRTDTKRTLPVTFVIAERLEDSEVNKVIEQPECCVGHLRSLVLYHQWLSRFGNTVRFGAFSGVVHVLLLFTTVLTLLFFSLLFYVVFPKPAVDTETFALNYTSFAAGSSISAFISFLICFILEMTIRNVRSKEKDLNYAYYSMKEENTDTSQYRQIRSSPNDISSNANTSANANSSAENQIEMDAGHQKSVKNEEACKLFVLKYSACGQNNKRYIKSKHESLEEIKKNGKKWVKSEKEKSKPKMPLYIRNLISANINNEHGKSKKAKQTFSEPFSVSLINSGALEETAYKARIMDSQVDTKDRKSKDFQLDAETGEQIVHKESNESRIGSSSVQNGVRSKPSVLSHHLLDASESRFGSTVIRKLSDFLISSFDKFEHQESQVNITEAVAGTDSNTVVPFNRLLKVDKDKKERVQSVFKKIDEVKKEKKQSLTENMNKDDKRSEESEIERTIPYLLTSWSDDLVEEASTSKQTVFEEYAAPSVSGRLVLRNRDSDDVRVKTSSDTVASFDVAKGIPTDREKILKPKTSSTSSLRKSRSVMSDVFRKSSSVIIDLRDPEDVEEDEKDAKHPRYLTHSKQNRSGNSVCEMTYREIEEQNISETFVSDLTNRETDGLSKVSQQNRSRNSSDMTYEKTEKLSNASWQNSLENSSSEEALNNETDFSQLKLNEVTEADKFIKATASTSKSVEDAIKIWSRSFVKELLLKFKSYHDAAAWGSMAFHLDWGDVIDWVQQVMFRITNCIVYKLKEDFFEKGVEDSFQFIDIQDLLGHLAAEILVLAIDGVSNLMENEGRNSLADLVLQSHFIMQGISQAADALIFCIEMLDKDEENEELYEELERLVPQSEIQAAIEGEDRVIPEEILSAVGDTGKYEDEFFVTSRLLDLVTEEAQAEVWEDFQNEQLVFTDILVKLEILKQLKRKLDSIEHKKSFVDSLINKHDKPKSRIQKRMEKRLHLNENDEMQEKKRLLHEKSYVKKGWKYEISQMKYRDWIKEVRNLSEPLLILSKLYSLFSKRWTKQGLKLQMKGEKCLAQSLLQSKIAKTKDADGFWFEDFLHFKRAESMLGGYLKEVVEDLVKEVVEEAVKSCLTHAAPVAMVIEDVVTKADIICQILTQNEDSIMAEVMKLEIMQEHEAEEANKLVQSEKFIAKRTLIKQTDDYVKPSERNVMFDAFPVGVWDRMTKNRTFEGDIVEKQGRMVGGDMAGPSGVRFEQEVDRNWSARFRRIFRSPQARKTRQDQNKDVQLTTREGSSEKTAVPDGDAVRKSADEPGESVTEAAAIQSMLAELKPLKSYVAYIRREGKLDKYYTLKNYLERSERKRQRACSLNYQRLIDSYYVVEEDEDNPSHTRESLYQLEHDLMEEADKPLPGVVKTTLVVIMVIWILFSFVYVGLVAGQLSTSETQEWICYYLLSLAEFGFVLEPFRAILIGFLVKAVVHA